MIAHISINIKNWIENNEWLRDKLTFSFIFLKDELGGPRFLQMNLRSKKGGIETRLLHMFSDQCTKLHFDKILFTDHLEIKPVHIG